jgi:hypothetical protein
MIRQGGGRHQSNGSPLRILCGASWVYLTLAALMLVWVGAASAQPGPCQLSWSLASFGVFLSTTPTDPGTRVDTMVLPTPLFWSWTGPVPTTPYYLSLTGIGTNGVESARSVKVVCGTLPASAFAVGAAVQPTTLLNVRTGAGMTAPMAGAPQAKGTLGVILAGPAVVTGTTWWQIQYPAVTGWSAEPFLVPVP